MYDIIWLVCLILFINDVNTSLIYVIILEVYFK